MNTTDTPTESAFVEHAFPWEKVGSFSRSDPYVKVWCYFAKGKPQKLTGSYSAIEEHIRAHGRPCFAHYYFGQYEIDTIGELLCGRNKFTSKSRSYWRFCNIPKDSGYLAIETCMPRANMYRRLGNNDHFAVTHLQNNKTVKSVRYRQLPKAFPKDFLYAVGVMP